MMGCEDVGQGVTWWSGLLWCRVLISLLCTSHTHSFVQSPTTLTLRVFPTLCTLPP